jgi:hypothetical protein
MILSPESLRAKTVGRVAIIGNAVTARFEQRLRLAADIGARTVYGVANGRSHKTFERHGFTVVRVNGQYTYFRKELTHEPV